MGSNVLVVEDEAVVAEDIKDLLTRAGYTTLGPVPNAKAAIDVVRSSPPDVILMDVKMPGDLDGIEAAIVIQQSRNKPIPIIFISAYEQGNFPHLMVVSPFRYLKKPYDSKELLRCISELCSA
ncbi:MAG TPA: response regulator [Acidobacteriota bacterium]|nr:response regulator [Acidobacteriota bacterium]